MIIPWLNFLTLSPFRAVPEYFIQSSTQDRTTTLPQWGLAPGHTWSTLFTELQSKDMKLIFLARHGESWHNVLEGHRYDELFDDDLTEYGVHQIQKLNQSWVEFLEEGGLGPQSWYVSPLQRTLHTFQLTWGENQSGTVVEALRERYYGHGCYQRHNRTWIQTMYPQMEFEDGFDEEDAFWSHLGKESKEDLERRVRGFLERLFREDRSSVVSVTSHAGTVRALLRVLGHPPYKLRVGDVLPLVVRGAVQGLD